MDTTRIVKKVTEWEPRSSRPVGRPRLRWLDQVEDDLKKMKVRNWRERSVKIEDCGNKIVKQVKTHQGL
jgi:heme oxygenase